MSTDPRPAHSPTPWRMERVKDSAQVTWAFWINASDGKDVCNVRNWRARSVPIQKDEPEANARYIVTAVNTHADAITLAREVVALLSGDRFGKAWYMDGSEFYRDAHKVEESARALLAKGNQ